MGFFFGFSLATFSGFSALALAGFSVFALSSFDSIASCPQTNPVQNIRRNINIVRFCMVLDIKSVKYWDYIGYIHLGINEYNR
ncbi:MAG: hypothetical protein IPO07_13170 [Haliscomenobacter sp.]|nr:hypothetical protein [Haliscomenobacter sp.]MBK9489625.1 hypothetical protein [Haliscomenobacter sp.]